MTLIMLAIGAGVLMWLISASRQRPREDPRERLLREALAEVQELRDEGRKLIRQARTAGQIAGPSDFRVVALVPKGSCDFQIVGERFYQRELESVSGGKEGSSVSHHCVATLRPEPENPNDPNAVMVMIDGRKVGYLRREHAAEFADALHDAGYFAAAQCRAWVHGIEGEGHHLWVRLDMEWPPEFVVA